MAQKITQEMTIEEILTKFPQWSQRLAQEMKRAGLNCVGCGAAVWETLEAGMLGHGFAEDELVKLLGRLNGILEEPIDLSTITFTKRAAEKYREFLEEEGKAGWGLRFGDRAGGCSGFEYELGYSEKALEGDDVFVSEGIEIHVAKTSTHRLKGCVIDFVEDLQDTGFRIVNPNAKGACSCGKSQNY